MAAPIGTIRYHRHNDDTATFHVVGRATMSQGVPLRRAGEALLASGVRHLRIDLRDCQYMDSTFLGTLITLHKALDRLHSGPLQIIAPSTPCTKILTQMGLTEILPTSQESLDTSANWIDVPSDDNDAGAFRQNVEQAHRALAALPGPAGEQFQAALRCIEQAAAPPPPPPARPPE